MYTKEIFEELVKPEGLEKSNKPLGEGKGSRVDALYRSLKSDLLCSKFGQGERLIEEKLAKQYGLASRTPVREVLARLKSEGHVGVSGRSFINPEYTPKALLQLYEVRLSLETLAVQHASKVGGDSSELRRCLTLMSDAQTGGEAVKVNAADGLFHLTIAEMSGNEVLITMLSQIHEKVFQIRNLFFTNEACEEDVIAAHAVLLAAIERGVEEVAMAEMSHHLTESREKFNNQLQR